MFDNYQEYIKYSKEFEESFKNNAVESCIKYGILTLEQIEVLKKLNCLNQVASSVITPGIIGIDHFMIRDFFKDQEILLNEEGHTSIYLIYSVDDMMKDKISMKFIKDEMLKAGPSNLLTSAYEGSGPILKIYLRSKDSMKEQIDKIVESEVFTLEQIESFKKLNCLEEVISSLTTPGLISIDYIDIKHFFEGKEVLLNEEGHTSMYVMYSTDDMDNDKIKPEDLIDLKDLVKKGSDYFLSSAYKGKGPIIRIYLK